METVAFEGRKKNPTAWRARGVERLSRICVFGEREEGKNRIESCAAQPKAPGGLCQASSRAGAGVGRGWGGWGSARGAAGPRGLRVGLGSILSSWEYLAASHGKEKKMTAGEAELLLISSTELWVKTVDFNVRGILQ